MKCAILVCGIRRSGTSMVAGVLEALGIPMGYCALDGNLDWNERYFEDQAFIDVFDPIMRKHPQICEGRIDSCKFREDLHKLQVLILNRCQNHDLWGAKNFGQYVILPHVIDYCPHLVKIITINRDFGASIVSYAKCSNRPLADIITESGWHLFNRDHNVGSYRKLYPDRVLDLDFEETLSQPIFTTQKIADFTEVSLTQAACDMIQPTKNHWQSRRSVVGRPRTCLV